MNPVDAGAFLATNASRIFVRAKVGERWGSYALTELPLEIAIPEVARLMGRLVNGQPVHVVPEEDVE